MTIVKSKFPRREEYINQNVYEAAVARMESVYERFDHSRKAVRGKLGARETDKGSPPVSADPQTYV